MRISKYYVILAIICLILAIITSCGGGPKDYIFRYVVDVDFLDGTTKTFTDEVKITCEDPEAVTFSMSSRFRKEPCVVLTHNTSGAVVGGAVNIACNARSFQTHSLEWRESKHKK